MAVIKVSKENFKDVVSTEKPVLIDFYADWCGPCKMLSPVVDEIAEENPQFVVGKVNVDEEEELAMEFGVMSIPTLIIFKNGNVSEKLVGVRPKNSIVEALEK
jgi:thioredoxin 1